MSRTDLDPRTLARSLRRMAGDGSVEWVMEPIQADVLCDVADLLVESAKLRELVLDMRTCIDHACMCEFCPLFASEDIGELRCIADVEARMRELGIEVGE